MPMASLRRRSTRRCISRGLPARPAAGFSRARPPRRSADDEESTSGEVRSLSAVLPSAGGRGLRASGTRARLDGAGASHLRSTSSVSSPWPRPGPLPARASLVASATRPSTSRLHASLARVAKRPSYREERLRRSLGAEEGRLGAPAAPLPTALPGLRLLAPDASIGRSAVTPAVEAESSVPYPPRLLLLLLAPLGSASSSSAKELVRVPSAADPRDDSSASSGM